MESLVSNLNKTTRRETLHGRSFVVAPITLIVPGVLKGSQGALFYSRGEIARNVDAWNGMPLTVMHPKDSSGRSVSGRTPAANEDHGVGNIYNATIVDGSLVGEAWFDVQTTENLSPEIAASLASRQKIEISTGLFTDNIKAPKDSEHDGEPFSFFATNLRPDHVAILSDQVGACSLDDGCGVLNDDQHAVEHEAISGDSSQGPEAINHIQNGGGKMPLNKEKKIALVAELIENCEHCDEADKAVFNAMSDEKLLAWQADSQKRIADTAVVNAVQEFAGDTPRDGLVEFVTNAAKKNAEDDEEDDENLTPEEKAEKAKPAFLKKNKDKDMVTKNEVVEPKTEAEWLAEAPASVQNMLRNAKQIEDEKKGELITQIVANVEDEKKKAAVVNQLKDKDLDELRILTSLVPAPDPVANVNYVGAQGSIPIENDGFDKDDVLVSPVMNWGSEG